MKNICSSCHSNAWIDDFYDGFDKAVEAYNEIYFKPAKAKLDELYEKGLLDKTKFFDKRLEVEDYELWHHEGRRARMGAMMMAPDYAWWHGFYEKAPFPAFGKGVFLIPKKVRRLLYASALVIGAYVRYAAFLQTVSRTFYEIGWENLFSFALLMVGRKKVLKLT